mgnify:CR=1 FL=1
MTKMIFVNLPVRDLAAATSFYEAIGCTKNADFSSDEVSSAVDAITEAAGKAGGKADIREPQDLGFMYGRAFEDPDGNIFEPVWMNMEEASGAQ